MSLQCLHSLTTINQSIKRDTQRGNTHYDVHTHIKSIYTMYTTTTYTHTMLLSGTDTYVNGGLSVFIADQRPGNHVRTTCLSVSVCVYFR